MKTPVLELKPQSVLSIGSVQLIVIRERCWLAEQSWCYELLVSLLHSGRLRVTIRRNAYDHQSWARVLTWTGDDWNRVIDLDISECACKELSYVTENVKPAQFHEDMHALLMTALQIVV